MELHMPNMTRSTQVALAARQGNFEGLKHILDNGEPGYVTDKRGWSPLHEAAFAGHPDCLELLLKHELHGNTEEFDIDCQTFDGETALILACKEGQASCAQILLESEANVDIINWKYTIHRWFIKGCTALHTAVRSNYPEIVKLLLKYKPEICCGIDGFTPVYIASEFGHVECLKLLLEKLKQQECGATDVTEDAKTTDTAMVVEEGYTTDTAGEEGETTDTADESYGCVQFLLQHNSRKSPNLYALDDLHPLCLAVGHSDINCFKLLINYGFDPDELFYDDTGRCGTLLCFGPSYQVAEYILEQGLLDLTRAYNPAPGKLDPMVECLNATGNISKLSQVLLTYGARIEDNAKFWKQILNTKLNSACSKFRCVSALYFMTKCGCELKKVFTFVRMEEITIPAYRIHRPALTSLRPDGVGVLSLYMLLTPNIKNQETLVEERVYPEASRVFQQIEADSHTLQHACRIAVARRLIFLDHWDSDRLATLDVPNIIKEYLKFMEYGLVGENFRILISAQRSYWNGSLTVSELEKKLTKLHMK